MASSLPLVRLWFFRLSSRARPFQGMDTLNAPTAWAAFQNVPMMQQAVEHGGNRGTVYQQFPPSHQRVGSR